MRDIIGVVIILAIVWVIGFGVISLFKELATVQPNVHKILTTSNKG